MEKQTLPLVLLSLLETASEGFWLVGDDNVVQFYNSSFYKQFALSTENSTLNDWLALVHSEDREQLTQELDRHRQDQASASVTMRYRVKNTLGSYLCINATVVRVECQSEFGMVGSHKNVSEEVLLFQCLKQISSHDGEAGLFNRHQFLQNASCLNNDGWIILCCLTQSRHFQQRVGHDARGRLSLILVSILDEVLSLEYGLYRISADVFVVTLEQSLDADRLLSLMNQIDSSFHKGRVCSAKLTGRIGLAAFPINDMNLTLPLEQIFNLSEYTRMVRSPVIYTEDSQRDIERHFAIQDAIETAIELHQITIVLQPIVEASTGDLISFEALARWEHPDLGSISPVEFIPIAESLGHIHALGMVVLAHACQYLVTFDETHQVKPLVNVNVSAHQLLTESFVDDVFDVVTRFDVSPNHIVLEVTESYLLDEDLTITSTLNGLHAHGFKLSIDDFGAGMSAITSLFRLPWYQVKMDRALINEAMRRDACLKLITHLCEFGRTHNIALVAEGVETTAMFDKLIEAGVPYLQGYCLYRPCSGQVWLEKSALAKRRISIVKED